MRKSTKEETKPAAPVTPIRPPKKTELSLRINYTEKELLEIGKRLAEANRELENAESEKKGITATLKAKCDSIASRIQQHSGELTNGYTFRNIPCEVRFDAPDKGKKTTVRLDSNETISVEAMTLAEMQADLPFGEAPKTAAPGVVPVPADDDEDEFISSVSK